MRKARKSTSKPSGGNFLEQEGVKGGPARRKLALVLAHLYRAISRKRLRLYPGVKQVLDELRPHAAWPSFPTPSPVMPCRR